MNLMFRYFILFLVFTFAYLDSDAQNWNSIYSKEIEAEDFILDKQYEKAANKYQDALKLMPSNANLSYKVGITLLKTPNKKHLAIDYLKEASTRISVEYDPRAIKEENAPPVSLYHLGRAYQMANMFDEAISAFISYKEYLQPNDPLITHVDKRIESCKLAPKLMADVKRVKKTDLGEFINNKNSNFNPVISGDGNTLAFTRIASDGYDIYVSRKKSGKWEKPKKITDDLGATYLKTASLSYDGNWLYLVDDFAPISNIFDTFFEDGYWVRSKKLKKPITSKSNETHAFISPDGKILYFTSDRPGGLGGLDIYKSTQDQKGRWGEPVNLGPQVNTALNEENPFITPDGKYLFFSSEGHSTMGGYDVFYTELEGNGEVVNLGYPLNNSDDNLFFFPTSIDKGFVALNNPNGMDQLDIFEVEIFPPIVLNGRLASSIEGADSQANLNVSITNLDESRVVATLNSNLNTGSFSQKIIPGNYQVALAGDGFEDYTTDFSIPDDYSNSSYDLEIVLNPIIKQPVLAEIIEETKAEEVKQEYVVDQTETEKAIVPEVKPEPIIVEQPKQEVAVIDEPKKEVVKEEPKIIFSGDQGEFTVQILALIVPVDIESFKNIEGVNVTKGSDGFYRYTVGSTKTKDEALQIRSKLISMGYKGAFVRTVPKPVEFFYTIQFMALRNPVDVSRFNNLENVFVEMGSDNIYRYNSGQYNTLDNANFNLQRVIELGYKDAFVKKK